MFRAASLGRAFLARCFSVGPLAGEATQLGQAGASSQPPPPRSFNLPVDRMVSRQRQQRALLRATGSRTHVLRPGLGSVSDTLGLFCLTLPQVFTMAAAAVTAAWAIYNKIGRVEVDLGKDIARAREDLGKDIGRVREDLGKDIAGVREKAAIFEGATASTLQQHSGQLQELLQLAREKK